VPFYQPETAFTVFTRVIDGTQISTGETIKVANFTSSGPMNATHKNVVGSKAAAPRCWIRALNDTCSRDQISSIMSGKGVVGQGVWYSNAKQYSAPSSTSTGSKASTSGTGLLASSKSVNSGSSSTTSVALTGVFTATATPSPSQGGASGGSGHMHDQWIQSLLLLCVLVVVM
jgi:hypothetical protein